MKDTEKRFEKVQDFHRKEAYGPAVSLCREILADQPTFSPAIGYLASWELHQGNLGAAARCYENAIAAGGGTPENHYALAGIFSRSGEWKKAAENYLAILREDIRQPVPLLYLGSVFERMGEPGKAAKAYSLGVDMGDSYLALHDDPKTPEQTRQLILAADGNFREALTSLHIGATGDIASKYGGANVSRIANAVWVQTHTAPVAFANPLQQPWYFYIPELRAQPFYDRAEFGWIPDFEASFGDIRREVAAGLDVEKDTLPYLRGALAGSGLAEHLENSPDWSSLHFYKDMKVDEEVCRRFPATAAALKKAPLVEVESMPIEALFSVLRPDTHITPHFGLANSRIKVHLPIIVPGDCAIKVGGETHAWKEGECVIFDDSFDHEAWNRSGKIRIVLIFEIWHPDLSEAERTAIEHSFSLRQEWLDTRERDVLAVLD